MDSGFDIQYVSRYQRVAQLLDSGLNNEAIAKKTGEDLLYVQQVWYRKFGPKNAKPRLTEDEKQEIVAQWETGATHAAIAESMGRSLPTVSAFLKRYQDRGASVITQRRVSSSAVPAKNDAALTLPAAIARAKQIADELGLVLEISVKLKDTE